MEKIGDFFNDLFEKIKSNPALAGYVISGLGVVLLIAVIMDADWMLEGGNGFFNIATISRMFGRGIARILMGIVSVLIIIAGLLISWGSSHQ